MKTIHFARILPICGLFVILLAGCGDKHDAPPAPSSPSGTPSGTAASPENAVQSHLNNPNVSEAEKAQIRKHMAPGGQ